VLYLSFLVFTLSQSATKEDLAKNLLGSPLFVGIKTMEEALMVADLIEEVMKNYTTPEPVSTVPFPCIGTGRSNPPPTDAKKLLPGDIDLIISLGDSITTGALANGFNPIFEHWDARQYSFSSGYTGFSGFNGLATSLIAFNPYLSGYSVGPGDQNSPNSRLNVAVDGAVSADLVTQAYHLLDKLDDNYPRWQDSWKHISIFIGGNDLCASCTDWNKYSPPRFQQNIEAVLDTIKLRIPKVFVSLITPPDVTLLTFVNGPSCFIFPFFTCGCKTNSGTKELHGQYSKVLDNIEKLSKYNDKTDFYVSVQPFMQNVHLPEKPDGSVDTAGLFPLFLYRSFCSWHSIVE
jgi:phospholipase B1